MLAKIFRPTAPRRSSRRKLGEVAKRFARVFFEASSRRRSTARRTSRRRCASTSRPSSRPPSRGVEILATAGELRIRQPRRPGEAQQRYYGLLEGSPERLPRARTTPELNTLISYLNEGPLRVLPRGAAAGAHELAAHVVHDARLADSPKSAGYKIFPSPRSVRPSSGASCTASFPSSRTRCSAACESRARSSARRRFASSLTRHLQRGLRGRLRRRHDMLYNDGSWICRPIVSPPLCGQPESMRFVIGTDEARPVVEHVAARLRERGHEATVLPAVTWGRWPRASPSASQRRIRSGDRLLLDRHGRVVTANKIRVFAPRSARTPPPPPARASGMAANVLALSLRLLSEPVATGSSTPGSIMSIRARKTEPETPPESSGALRRRPGPSRCRSCGGARREARRDVWPRATTSMPAAVRTSSARTMPSRRSAMATSAPPPRLKPGPPPARRGPPGR